MSQYPDLKELERKAFRSTYQDGIWDIYIGALLVFICLINLLPDTDQSWSRIGLILLGMMGIYGLFWLGKKFVTTPRLGQVRFGPERRKKKLILGLILGIFVLVNLLLLAYTIAVNRNPVLGETVRTLLPGLQVTRLVLGAFIGVFVGSAMAFIAYYNDFPRGYYIALVFAAGFFLAEWLDRAIFFAIAAALIGVPGIVLFVRFIQDHPLPVEK